MFTLEIPKEYIEMTQPGGVCEGGVFTPIAQPPIQISDINPDEYPELSDSELDTIYQMNGIFEEVDTDNIPQMYVRMTMLMGNTLFADQENSYFEAVRHAWMYVPDDKREVLASSTEFKAIEFMYYSAQRIKMSNSVLAMMLHTSTLVEPQAA